MNQRLIIFLGVIFTLFSCTKETTQSFTDFPILEAYLEPQQPFSMLVSRQVPFDEDVIYSEDDIDNLSILVENNGISYLLTPVGDGIYVDSSLIVAEGESYNLSFMFDSKEVTAYTYIPSKPTLFEQSLTEMYIEAIDTTSGPPTGGITQPDPIELTWSNDDDSYYLVVVENMEEILDPIRDFGDEAPPGNRFRKSPTNSTLEELRFTEFQYFGMHRVILYHVLPDYATLYDENSTSSQNITNPSTSIANGYGIFTGLNSDTLYVDVIEQ